MNYVGEFWTSELIIQSDKEFDPQESLKTIEEELIAYDNNRKHDIKEDSYLIKYLYQIFTRNVIESFANYSRSDKLDYTGVIKGLAILDMSLKAGDSSTISFGGDICVRNKSSRIRVSDKFFINLSNGCVFTSNNKLRPGHIKCKTPSIAFDSVTVVGSNPVVCDYYATKYFSEGGISRENVYLMKGDLPTLEGRKVYCASPFFCEEDKKVRDEMIKPFKFAEIFRPDLTKASKSYDKSPGKDLASIIYKENMENINLSDILIFPKRTKDLGTLMEVGEALNLGKVIISYDHMTGIYEVIDNERARTDLLKIFRTKEKRGVGRTNVCIRLSSPGNAILLGYLKTILGMTIYYQIPEGLHDNIMLAHTYQRVDENFRVMSEDREDID